METKQSKIIIKNIECIISKIIILTYQTGDKFQKRKENSV